MFRWASNQPTRASSDHMTSYQGRLAQGAVPLVAPAHSPIEWFASAFYHRRENEIRNENRPLTISDVKRGIEANLLQKSRMDLNFMYVWALSGRGCGCPVALTPHWSYPAARLSNPDGPAPKALIFARLRPTPPIPPRVTCRLPAISNANCLSSLGRNCCGLTPPTG